METNGIKILPYELFKFEDGEVGVDDVSVTYYQNGDCTEDRDDTTQSITLSTRNNGCARFINIKTDNWSIDPYSDDFKKLLDDFIKRASIEDERV